MKFRGWFFRLLAQKQWKKKENQLNYRSFNFSDNIVCCFTFCPTPSLLTHFSHHRSTFCFWLPICVIHWHLYSEISDKTYLGFCSSLSFCSFFHWIVQIKTTLRLLAHLSHRCLEMPVHLKIWQQVIIGTHIQVMHVGMWSFINTKKTDRYKKTDS